MFVLEVSWYKSFGAALLLLVCLLAPTACGPSGGIRASGPDNVIDPAVRGPYAVGVKTLRLEDKSRVDKDTGKARPMVVEIWYPAVDGSSTTATDTYDPNKEAPQKILKKAKESNTTLPTLTQVANRDAKPLKSEGPYPLILFSHGSGGIRFQSTFYCPHLASHGYVVVSVDHEGNTLYDLLTDPNSQDQLRLAQIAIKRPEDLQFLHAEVKKRNKDPKDLLYQLVKPEEFGVTGHSFGGLTSIWAASKLPGVKVIIPQTPHTTLVRGFVQPSEIEKIPVMVMASHKDKTLPYQAEQRSFYDLLLTKGYHGAERYLVSFKRGGHFTYSDICDFDLASTAKKMGLRSFFVGVLSDGCEKDENIEVKSAHQYINRYATAMFNVILRKSEGSRKYLVAANEKEILFEHKAAPASK
mgnify:CR=1 FL=1